MVRQGRYSEVRIGKQTDYDTAAAATTRLELIREAIEPVRGTIPDPSLYNARSRRGIYPGSFKARGPVVLRANYEGLEEIFRAVFGDDGYSATLVGGETIVRDHEFIEGNPLNPLTMQFIKGEAGATTSRRLVGGIPASIRVSGAAGDGQEAMVRVELQMVGKDLEPGAALTGSLSFPPVLPVLMNEQLITVDNGVVDTGVHLRSFEFLLDNILDENRNYGGSSNVLEPIPNDFMNVTMRMELEFDTEDLFEACRDAAAGSPRLVWQHPTTIGVGSKREFELRCGSAILPTYSDPTEGVGVMISTATWEAWHDTADASAAVARFRNLVAALA